MVPVRVMHCAEGGARRIAVRDQTEDPMGEMIDKAKGHIKQAAGNAMDSDELRGEGAMDRAKGAVKGAVDGVTPMGEMVDKTKGKVKQAVGRATNDDQLESEGVVDELKGKVKGAVNAVKGAVKSALHR